jgi:hypothetical protein
VEVAEIGFEGIHARRGTGLTLIFPDRAASSPHESRQLLPKKSGLKPRLKVKSFCSGEPKSPLQKHPPADRLLPTAFVIGFLIHLPVSPSPVLG